MFILSCFSDVVREIGFDASGRTKPIAKTMIVEGPGQYGALMASTKQEKSTGCMEIV